MCMALPARFRHPIPSPLCRMCHVGILDCNHEQASTHQPLKPASVLPPQLHVLLLGCFPFDHTQNADPNSPQAMLEVRGGLALPLLPVAGGWV